MIKFTYDTTVIGLMTMMKQPKVENLELWCQEKNLSLNVDKTKGIIFDYKRPPKHHSPIQIRGTGVERVK